MKKFLLLIAGLLAMVNVFAQPSPITGSSSVCVGSTITLSDAMSGGTWSSRNPAVASVGATTGIVTGVSADTVTIKYTTLSGSVSKRITVNAIPAAITGPSTVCIGGTLPVTLTDATPGGTWTSANPFIVSVGSTTGIITGISSGSIAITYALPTGCASTTTVTANSLTISGGSVICVGGSTTTLSDATPGGVWTSSNTSIATVGPTTGVVSPVADGSAFITYTLSPGCVSTASVVVKSLPSISPSSVSGCVGYTYQLTGNPPGGGWASSNPAVATVNFLGVVTGVASGTATITYTAAGGCAVTIPVTIHPIPATITGTNYVFSTLTTTLGDPTPGGTWSSGNTLLATVNPATGVVTGVSAGSVLISYTLSTGCSNFYRVEVNPLPGTTNIYAWYPFCGDSSDHSGTGKDLINHGPPTTAATLTTDRFGSPRSAYHFNGVNSMMNYSTFFVNAGTPPDFTYSCWVNPSGPQSSIILYNGNPTVDGFGFVMNNGTMGTPGTNVGVYFGGSATLYATQPLSPVPGWHNLVLVKSGGVYHFYIDDGPGVFFLETNTPIFSEVFALGLNYNSTLPGRGPMVDAYNGDIDDVAYITRQLSNAERLSLFNYNPDVDSFSLGNDTTVCTDAMTLVPHPGTIGAIYTWSQLTGLAYTTLDTIHSQLTVYPAAGPFGNQYVLEVAKTQPYGCKFFDTIVVYKAPIPVALGPDLNQCIGDTVTLFNNFPSASFLWSTGDTTHSITVTTTGTYYVTVDSTLISGTDTAVCVGRDTVNIAFHAVPFVSVPAAPINCQGNPVMIWSYFDTAYTYLWTGPGTLVAQDTINVTQTGQYIVRVNDHGCFRFDTTTVSIVYDTVTFVDFVDTAICRNAPPITTHLATYNSIVTYQWTPTAGIAISNTNSPSISPDTSAEYYLTVKYPGCPDIVDSFHVDVQPNPTVYMGGNRDVCAGDTIHISATVDPNWYQHYIYSWTPNIGLDNTGSSIVVFNTNAATQDTSIKFIVTVVTPAWTPSVTGCFSQDSGIITIHPRHFAELNAKFDLCPGDSVQLVPADTSSLGSNIVASRWIPGLYLSDSLSPQPWVFPIASQDYTLIAYSQYGCKDTMAAQIIVHPAALIKLDDSAIIYPGDSYQIIPQTNCIYFQWFPPLGLDNPQVANPTASPLVNTTYYVKASTEAGCTTLDSFRVHVDPTNLITLPNAFTPGASVNNRFYVLKKGIVALNYFRIFDRWGNMVYESKNIDEGWDGTYKGQPQPFAVYVYEVEATSVTGAVFTRRGNVTLLR